MQLESCGQRLQTLGQKESCFFWVWKGISEEKGNDCSSIKSIMEKKPATYSLQPPPFTLTRKELPGAKLVNSLISLE